MTQSAENDSRQWAVRAASGVIAFTSEETAQVAVAEGYTLGTHRSPVVEALTRATPDDEWERVIPPVKGADA